MIFADSVIADRLQALTRAIDAAAPLPGSLLLVDASANVLASVPFALPSSGGVESGVLSLAINPSADVQASGDVAAAQIVAGDGATVASMSAGLPGSGAEVEITNPDRPDSLTLYAGGTVQVTVAQLAEV